ncbi:hypothetical protein ACQ856_30350 (plasmid) [Mycolicibacterium psychrotolerans]|uniref:hypothetical protein n=1 Tax=Mycolicibacterium psychrotolerans TaxID=216929 RepID=UPI003D67C2B1
MSAWLPPAEEPTRIDQTRQEYQRADGARLFTNDPGIKAAIDTLTDRWPWTISRDELVETVAARLLAAGVTPGPSLASNIENLMATLVLQGGVDYRLVPVLPEPTHAPFQLPATARRMAELTRTQPIAATFNMWHETLILSPIDRHLFPLLDGTRDRDALISALLAVNRMSPLEFDDVDPPPSVETQVRHALTRYLDDLPQHLAAMKLIRS